MARGLWRPRRSPHPAAPSTRLPDCEHRAAGRHHKFRAFEVRPLCIAFGKCEVLNERFDLDSHAAIPRGKRTLKRFGTTEMHDVCRSASHLRKGHQVMNAIRFDLRWTAFVMLRRISFSGGKKFTRSFRDKRFILAVRSHNYAQFLANFSVRYNSPSSIPNAPLYARKILKDEIPRLTISVSFASVASSNFVTPM